MPSPRGFVQLIDQSWHREKCLPPKGRLLVAVSGGADSVALLRLMAEVNRSNYWNWELVVGHVDHGIRGAASRGDAAWVKGLAEELALPFVLRRLKLARASSEEAARDGRLRAFKEMVRVKKCLGVVMGHHADDQAETVVMRMMRGCGLEGLSGMRAESRVRGLLIFRPLLGARREALRDFLRRNGHAWREDETNRESRYRRNRIRMEILPAMEAVASGTVNAIGRLSQMAHEAQGVLDREATRVSDVATLSARVGNERRYARALMLSGGELICGEIVRRVLGKKEADFERIRAAVRLVMEGGGGKCVQLGGGKEIQIEGREVILRTGRRGREQ